MNDSPATRPNPQDLEALAGAIEMFTQTTQRMEEAYRALERRLQELDRELEKKNHQLAVASDYLSNLLECMTDGVIAVDREERVTRFNRAAGVMLGYTSDDVVGRPFAEVFGRKFPAPAGSGTLLTRSGRRLLVNERDAPVADQSGRRLGSVKTFQDLSELEALREQVRQRDRLIAIGEMAATVAHEIRNPLGGIRGFASLLAQDLPPGDDRRRLVDKILAGTHSLDRVVTELLEYTRPVELKLRPVACTTLLEAALPYLEYDLDRISIAHEIPTGLNVLADPEKIRQVLLNLLLNAVQSITGTGEIIVTAAVCGDKFVELTVSDSGCGIAAEQLESVFSPFFTTKQKGTGLGLAICQKIVEGHGGTIRAGSTEGVGSEFTLTLARAE